jgi:conjugal transfer pilus assembly protein TraF
MARFLIIALSLWFGVNAIAALAVVPEKSGKAKKENPTDRYRGSREGFFFYEDDNPEEREDKKTRPKPRIIKRQLYKKGQYDGKMRWNDVDNLSTAEMRDLLEDVKDYAIQHPTFDNVKDYMVLQAVAMERATRFQQAWAEVLNENPVLDENAKRPATAVVSGMMVVQRRDDEKAAIESMRRDMGILFFYSDDCPYCDKQQEILANFVNRRGWENVTGINISKEPKLIEEYGIQLVPDLWVVGNVKGEIRKRRISAGVSTGADIERGILQAHSRWFEDKPYAKKAYVPVTEFDEYLQRMKDRETDAETAADAGEIEE